MPEINWIAVIVAAIAAFAVGALWYSPILFARQWQKEVGLSDEDAEGAPMVRIMVSAFVLILLATIVFAMFLGPSPGLAFGLGTGFLAGLFWVAAMTGVHYLFERRSLRLWLINGGYNTVVFVVIGGVLGAFP